ncbi:aminotransferase class III-fold pyridoxal phosphate-dependent enzyme [Haloferax mediterranei ATCC 33500]|uniref:4-aminobutyrate aminotransferase n=1 Tax=Haloferax mediterranei (strain ATCC 33500 / DSM 1411 / JCM 8866 / NBRC 14739 / NCIMB 2177 / R-4) TaxID=523841 RepID=I3R8H5_HALMT|nr:aminotransferase class III-fold pyridoxal phosphate-dependent enzyme [Haloferax mediterranei]AFK20535.2 4-aminobutyrate aminotransferase [Haloferax mediterranei ATCC 33500]AHZ23892.1 4-aminobutyrate aminotransferase [Haloferax mediterranei ATCC 33500]ELZ98317.1 4-aminobutyrate aminotransferase [Haloferax mediterranei ATCC 33500]MDX5986710.1 aminotransferase class III-fold pyridoxal phosphate-dependent enzyme [Haloferax mediterranei ATCC 33500]QCQ76036.1 aminotransferase class III-fold pyrid
MDRETAEPHVDTMPGKRAREWVEYHHDHAAPSTYVYDFVWDITAEAEGPFCTDVDGNVLLDFTSHVAAAPLGYNNPKIMDRMSEFDLVDPTKIAGQDFYVSDRSAPGEEQFPGPAALMDKLTDLTSHYGMDTVFLSNSGAEAVENAIKISYDNADGAKYGITFEGAFHGRTLGALSLNRSKSVYRRKYPEISGVLDVPFCDDRSCSPETCSCGFFPDSESAASKLRQKLHPETGHVDADEVAYVIVEPVQGEGGYRFPSDAFADELAAVVDDYDLTLIADEIQSGVGRTGEMWGADNYPMEPDVITGAKGLRVGATISNSDIFPSEKSRLSSTWGAGDILSSMQGVFTLEAIEDYDLLDNAVAHGRQFKETVRDSAPDTVTDVRGKGLLLAVEFDSKDRRDDAQEAALKRGLLTLACGHKVLRILPPLDVTEREIDIGANMLLDAIGDVS